LDLQEEMLDTGAVRMAQPTTRPRVADMECSLDGVLSGLITP